MNSIIVNIYYGSIGNAGSYIHKIIEAQNMSKIPNLSIVNYRYIFDDDNCYKIFFRFSESVKNKNIRKMIKFIEYYIDYYKIFMLIRSLSHRYDKIYIDYSLNENFIFNYQFLKLIKTLRNASLVITIHDVIPMTSNYPQIMKKTLREFLDLADSFIVHNNYTADILATEYNIESKHIYRIAFPLMDIGNAGENTEVEGNGKIIFLFIGSFRKEKGLDVLINAWNKIKDDFDNAILVIAGKIPKEYEHSLDSNKRIKVVNRYLSDREYIKYIAHSDYVVLPYIGGTNSGVLSNVTALGKPAITSDIEMFKESKLNLKRLMFSLRDQDALYKMMRQRIENYDEEYKGICEEVKKLTIRYNDSFKKDVEIAFSQILMGK